MNCAMGQDLRAEAAAMTQALEYGAVRQPLQMIARFAEAYAADLYLANQEFVANQMIERHPASDQITTSFSHSDVYAVIALERLDRFRLNQSQFEIGERFEKGSLPLGIAIAFQSNPRNSVHLIDGLGCGFGSGGDVDGFNGSGPHNASYAPCGWPEPAALRDCSSTIVMHSSRTSMATSASSLVTMSGGAMRTVLGPQPRNRMPRSKASSTMRSRSWAPYSFVVLSLTISTPIIRPRPRTSPTKRCFCGQAAMRFS